MEKKIVGYTTGVFDLFHVGHLNILKKAKLCCDYLIVGVSTDELVYKYKNKYPVIPYNERVEIIKAIRYVDEVVEQKNMNKYEAWEKLHFDKYFHGDDWKNTELYKITEEKLKKVGVKVVYFPYTVGTSSTIIKNFLYNNYESEKKLMTNYRDILENSIDYAIKNNTFHSLNIIENTECLCIWGAGDFFKNAYERMFKQRNIKISYIVDSNKEKQGKKIIDGIDCISPEELLGLNNPVVIPYLCNGFDEVCDFCIKNNIKWIHKSHFMLDMQDMDKRSLDWFKNQKEKIMSVYDFLYDDQSKKVYSYAICSRISYKIKKVVYPEIYSPGEYFNPDIVGFKLNQQESFLDVGAFNGDTIEKFLSITNGRFSHIFALEMSKKNYEELKKLVNAKNIDVRNKIDIINCGAWNETTTTICGDERNHSGIACSIKGKRLFLKADEIEVVQLDKIDNLIKEKNVSLIKMDIEGAEVKAIKGAESCISNNLPKMAVCLYHNLSDYWEVPLSIKEINHSYNIAVRHHSNDNGGTVCYAWI